MRSIVEELIQFLIKPHESHKKMEVKAQLNNYRRSPRKIRLVAKALKGLDADFARQQLRFLVKGSAPDLEKLLKSAMANAENNLGLAMDNLYIKDLKVDEGSTLKRWLPRAHGRASLLLKRTSHIELVLAEKVEGKGRKKIKKQAIKDIKAEEIKKIEKETPEEKKDEMKEISKEREEKEFLDEKKKSESSKGFLKRVFRRKSM